MLIMIDFGISDPPFKFIQILKFQYLHICILHALIILCISFYHFLIDMIYYM